MTPEEMLVELDRELKRCIEDAVKHRNALISATSFSSDATLATIDAIDIERAVSNFEACIRRAGDLRRRRSQLVN